MNDAHLKALVALLEEIQHHRQLDRRHRTRAADQYVLLVLHSGASQDDSITILARIDFEERKFPISERTLEFPAELLQ